jgi:hypothetical protein
MSQSSDQTPGGDHPASALMLSAAAGAVLGAAGLAWWLLAKAERRRRHQRQLRQLRLSRLQAGAREADPAGQGVGIADRALRQRVEQLNEAIEQVRRQLEALQPLP